MAEETLHPEEKVDATPVEEAEVLEATEAEPVDSSEKSPEALEIERLQAENDALADKVLRAQAELQNVQKRQAKERADLMRYRSQQLAQELLPVLDSLDRALAIQVEGKEAEALKKGIEMAQASFLLALKSEGIEAIEALNQKFDPNLHQAIQQVEAEGVEADTITQEYQKGYKIHDRVLRPSMVVVSN